MAITAAFETGDIIDPSTGQPAISVIDEKQLSSIAGQLRVPYVHRTRDDGGSGVVEAVRLKELAPLRATDAAEIVGGRSELGWVALLLLAALAAWELGTLVAAASRRRARPVAASAAELPRARMRLPALRSTRGWPAANSPGGPATTPVAPPFDPAAPPLDPSAGRAPETSGTGARR